MKISRMQLEKIIKEERIKLLKECGCYDEQHGDQEEETGMVS